MASKPWPLSEAEFEVADHQRLSASHAHAARDSLSVNHQRYAAWYAPLARWMLMALIHRGHELES